MALGRGAFVSPLGHLAFPDETNSMFDYFKDLLVGKPASYDKIPNRFDEEQQGILRNLLRQGSQGLGTDAIEGAARRGYQQSTIPLLSERFANIGQRGLSGIGSSGYENALQESGTDLETQLAALRQGNAMNLMNLGLQDQQDYRFTPETQGAFPDILSGLIRAGTAYATGGGSEIGNIMDLFKDRIGGGGGSSGGSNFDIQGGAQRPFERLLANQSGNQLLNQRTQSQLGLPGVGQNGGSIQAQNMLRQGGTSNILNLMKQSTMNGLRIPQQQQQQQGNSYGWLGDKFLNDNRQPYRF